jgi:hypothetical protein
MLFSLTLFQGGFAQQASDPNSASFLNDVLRLAVEKMEKRNENIVHAESGIFTINKNLVSDYTSRRLYPGNTYTIVVFTDTRIQDFKLLVWKSNEKKEWVRYDSVNESDHAKMTTESIGDKETIHLAPAEERDYAFQLISNSNANKTGRYGVVIIAEVPGAKNTTSGNGDGSGGTGASGSGTTNDGANVSGGRTGVNGGTASGGASNTGKLKTFLSCDYYSFAYLKKGVNDKWVLDGDWSRTDESSLFVLNPEETIFEHTTPTIKSSYYVQSKKNEGKVYNYEVKSDVGNSYTFEVDLEQNKIDIVGKTDKGRWFIVRRHLKRVWTE